MEATRKDAPGITTFIVHIPSHAMFQDLLCPQPQAVPKSSWWAGRTDRGMSGAEQDTLGVADAGGQMELHLGRKFIF